MMKFLSFLIFILIIFNSCTKDQNFPDTGNQSDITEVQINQVIDALIKKYGADNSDAINKGVKQTSLLWNENDGDFEVFKDFCINNFVDDPVLKDKLFDSFSRNNEILSGYFNRIMFDLKVPMHEDTGELIDLDYIFAGYDPSATLAQDMYSKKIAFIITLNFPFYSLDEKINLGKNWNRKQWAYAKLGDVFTSRVPGELTQKFSEINTESSNYIAEYNIFMGKIVDNENKSYFPEDMKLISHWNLRDEIKSNYSFGLEGLKKQELIYDIMLRIINQDIPKDVINNGDFYWNPITNKLYDNEKEIQFEKENNQRYQYLLENFKILKEIDEHSPHYPTYIQRKFNSEMQMKQEDVEKLFVDFVSSPVVKKVGELIQKRLGRDLKPHDIWYDGFKARAEINEEDLSRQTRKLFPDAQSFDDYLPQIFKKLNFDNSTSEYLSERIEVDDARGAGHAWGAEMKGQQSHLRTRLPDNGMDYKGFNIAMHELGHNVEQTFSLYDIDYYMLNGVPNTAFTEAMAFLFQHRDLKVLDKSSNNSDLKSLQALDIFWNTYEIMGVSIVDMRVWKWLYNNPEANAQQLKENVIRIAKEVWNDYYAPVFGVKDQEILAIYSHMISYPLYLSAYPIGKLIEFQLEEQIQSQGGELAFPKEVQRMCVIGSIIPDYWMQEAVGDKLSGKPLLNATEEAVKIINNN